MSKDVHERLDDHEEVHQRFDRRISRNENWRLQAQGALKVLALVAGSGIVGLLADMAGIV
jgi:hypothetical protein